MTKPKLAATRRIGLLLVAGGAFLSAISLLVPIPGGARSQHGSTAERAVRSAALELLDRVAASTESGDVASIRMAYLQEPLIAGAIAFSAAGERLYPPMSEVIHVRDRDSMLALDSAAQLAEAARPGSSPVAGRVWDGEGRLLLFCQRPSGRQYACVLTPVPRFVTRVNEISGQAIPVLPASIDTAPEQRLAGFPFLAVPGAGSSGISSLMRLIGLLAGFSIAVLGLMQRQPGASLAAPQASASAPEATAISPGFRMHDLTVFPEALRAGRAGQVIELTARDLRILALLHERAGRPVSKDELYDAAWGRNYMPNSRALEQYILSLRRKLEVSPDLPPVIETVHGHGYRFDPQSRG